MLQWNIIVSPLHYVPDTPLKKNDMLVANLSKPPDHGATGEDVNSRSLDPGHDTAQADFVDDAFSRLCGFSAY